MQKRIFSSVVQQFLKKWPTYIINLLSRLEWIGVTHPLEPIFLRKSSKAFLFKPPDDQNDQKWEMNLIKTQVCQDWYI